MGDYQQRYSYPIVPDLLVKSMRNPNIGVNDWTQMNELLAPQFTNIMNSYRGEDDDNLRLRLLQNAREIEQIMRANARAQQRDMLNTNSTASNIFDVNAFFKPYNNDLYYYNGNNSRDYYNYISNLQRKYGFTEPKSGGFTQSFEYLPSNQDLNNKTLQYFFRPTE